MWTGDFICGGCEGRRRLVDSGQRADGAREGICN